MARGQGSTSPTRRLAFVRLVFFVFLVIITWRLFQLQVLAGSYYRGLAAGQHDLFSRLIPERGAIYVQDPLAPGGLAPAAVNQQRTLVYAVPKEVTDAAGEAAKLAPVLGLDAKDIEALLGKTGDPYEPLKHTVTDAVRNQVDALALPGIRTGPEEVRTYPQGEVLGQVVGFVGFTGSERKGQYGIEGEWEQTLAGSQGVLRSEKDAAGGLIAIGTRDIVPAVDGADLVLTIDKNIQYRACTAIAEAVAKHGAVRGSVVVVEPGTGAVRALCNSPRFDPSAYAQVQDLSRFANAAVSDAYEPGSVFKPVTMAAALATGTVTPETTYEDTGSVTIGPDTIKNSDGKAHGVQTMTQVLESSLNTGAIFAMRQAGVDQFIKFVRDFGFGVPTGIELPHEQVGNLKALAGRKEIYAATASFGQGISVSVLQLAAAYTAIANQGRLMRPYLVAEVRPLTGAAQVTPPTFVRQVIPPQVASALAGMLVSVVERGHGQRAGVAGYYVAGKTGTAQVPLGDRPGYDPSKTIGTFAGFAPVDNPKFALVVKVDEPKDVVFAESSAAPTFGDLAKFLLEYYQVPPTRQVP